MKLTATVIVEGTDPELVRICLTHVTKLDPAPEQVIVVDTSGAGSLGRLIGEEFPHIRYVRSDVGPLIGWPAESNLATGDVVAFLGEDGIVAPDWLGELLAPYADADVVGVGGRVIADAGPDATIGVSDIGRVLPDGRLTKNFGGDPGRVIEVDHLPEGNMSFRRAALGDSAQQAAFFPAARGASTVALQLGRAGTLAFQPRAIVRVPAVTDEPVPPRDRRRLYSYRRDHVARLLGAFGWRDPLVRNFACTTIREQRQYLWLTASHLRSHKLTGERRSLWARARGLATLTGAAAEVAGLAAGLRGGLPVRRPAPGLASTPKGIRTRTLHLNDVGPEEEARWAQLSARAVEPNPFFDPRFIMSAHRILGNTDDIRLVIVERAGDWLAALPLSVIKGYASIPLRYATTAGELLGRRASLCVPLIDSRAPADAVLALLQHLSSRHSGVPGLIELTLMPDRGPVATLVRDQCRNAGIPFLVRSRFTRAYADSRSQVIAPEHCSRNRRKQLRRKRDLLERHLGTPLEYIDHGPSGSALEALLTLESTGWKGKRGSAVRMKDKEQEWFDTYMAAFLDQGDCRILELRAGDVSLHMSLVLVMGGMAFGTVDAFNETYRDWSPGTLGRVLEQQALLTRTDIAAMDPCMHPKYADATALYPGRRDIVSLLIATRPLARAALLVRSGLIRLKQSQRSRQERANS